jgi:phenylacetate-CoA ligase
VTLFSSYHLSDRYLAAYVEQLNRFQPELIDSYPSALHVVARYALTHGLPLPRPRAIVTSSETLLPDQRADIERAFGCAVRDQYGSAEMVAFIAQCEEGTYHVNPEYGITEVESDPARNNADGSGRLLCTGFLNTAMPLIRYEIGDTAVLEDGACGCGRHFPRVRALMGRIDDYVSTPDGRLVGRLDPVFKGVEGIAESQIVQDSTNHITVYLVPASGSVPAVTTLRENLQARLGADMAIDMTEVASIPRTRAGKFRAVVSLVSRPGDHDGVAGAGTRA